MLQADRTIGITSSVDILEESRKSDWIIGTDDQVLVTGAGGFVGTRVVGSLLKHGFRKVRCFLRDAGKLSRLQSASAGYEGVELDVVQGNLLSVDDCIRAVAGVSVIYHLAAGTEKSFAGSFLNSVVTTRNLLDAAVGNGAVRRFVNISSFAVYSNERIRRRWLLDETCEIEPDPFGRYEPYVYAKIKQDAIVTEYNNNHGLPFVMIRPGVVFGPGKAQITGRVGIDSFGFFLHLGGSNRIPFTYVENCADAIVLAGVVAGVDGEIFNIVDDDLPTSREFLRLYKKRVRRFGSLCVPYQAFAFFCNLWERYSRWSEGQLPPVFNKRRCAAYWKGNTYSNEKAKRLLGWQPAVGMSEALERYFEYARRTRKE